MVIRQEGVDDIATVRRVVELAFDRPNEAELVDRLRELKGVFSYVAELENEVVGHIMFSPVCVNGVGGDWHGIGLAPLSVHPDVQGRGIGKALARYGLEQMEAENRAFVAVLGEPAYYQQFGFVTSREKGVWSSWTGIDAKYLMIKILDSDKTKGMGGRLLYHSYFEEV